MASIAIDEASRAEKEASDDRVGYGFFWLAKLIALPSHRELENIRLNANMGNNMLAPLSCFSLCFYPVFLSPAVS